MLAKGHNYFDFFFFGGGGGESGVGGKWVANPTEILP